MTSISTQTLLIFAVRAWAPRLTRALHAAGHTNLQPRHGSVFMHADREGAFVRTLSERAGIAKSAMGALVDELERFGYLARRSERIDCPPLIVPTARGLEAIGIIRECNRQMEIELQQTLGNAGYHDLRQALQKLAESR